MSVTTRRTVSRFGALIATCTIGVLTFVVIVIRFNSPRTAAFVLLGFGLFALVLFLKLPPSAAEKRRIADKHKTASRLRRLSYVFVFLYFMGWISYFSSGIDRIPVWEQFLISLIPLGCFIVGPLWAAYRIERTPEESWRSRHG